MGFSLTVSRIQNKPRLGSARLGSAVTGVYLRVAQLKGQALAQVGLIKQ